MSRFTALFLAGIIGCQAFYNAGMLAYWVTNHCYIASVLCENRDRPQLHCDGKCYLKKKLAGLPNQATTTGHNLPDLKKGLELAECPVQPVSFLAWAEAVKKAQTPMCRCAYTKGFPQAVFQPPARRA